MVVLVGGKGESELQEAHTFQAKSGIACTLRKGKEPLGFLKMLSQFEFYKGLPEILSYSVFSAGVSFTLFFVMKGQNDQGPTYHYRQQV